MKNVSSEFNAVMASPTRALFGYITVGEQRITGNDNLLSFEVESAVQTESKIIGNAIVGVVKAEVMNKDSTLSVQKGDPLAAYIGADIGKELPEYVCVKKADIVDVAIDSASKKIIITAKDKMRLLDDHLIGDIRPFTYPIKRQDYIRTVCSFCGVSCGNITATGDVDIPEAPNLSGKETCRQVIAWLAEASLANAVIDDNEKLTFVPARSSTVAEIDGNVYMAMTVGKSYGAINRLVLGRGDLNDNVIAEDGESILENGLTELHIDNNPFLDYGDNSRALYISDMFDYINGYRQQEFQCEWIGNPAIEIGDIVSFKDIENHAFTTVYASEKLKFNGGMRSSVSCSYPTVAEKVNSSHAQTVKQAFENARIYIDKVNSRIDALAESITLKVTGSLGGTASIIMTANGQSIEQSIDMKEVRKAFADDKSAVVISGGSVTFNSGTFIVNSSNLTVDKDGTISAKNGQFSGKVITESGKYKTVLDGGQLQMFYDGTKYGALTSLPYTSIDPSRCGLSVRLAPGSNYFGVAHDADADGSYSWDYLINHSDVSGYTDRHVFFGSARFLNTVYCNAGMVLPKDYAIKVANDAEVAPIIMYHSEENYIRFGNTKYPVHFWGKHAVFQCVTHFDHKIIVNAGADFKTALTFDNSYGVRISDTNGEPKYVLSFTANNVCNVGAAGYALNLRGSTVAVASGSLDINNNEGVRIKSTEGDYRYVLYIGTNNSCYVGYPNDNLYLRGTTVYLASSNTVVTSDRRKKNSVEVLPGAYINMLDGIEPVRFKYNDGTSGRYHTGIIAQSLLEALEAAGLTSKDFGGYVDINGDGSELGIAYDEFIAVLIAKIKWMDRQLADLQKQRGYIL